MGARCQVCDGPVVKGRCKLCGMPYLNDEALYHLNESRTEHYSHATPKARKIMEKQAVTPGEQKKSQSRTSAKEEIRVRQEQIRHEAVKRMTAARVQGNTAQKNTAQKNAAGRTGNLRGTRGTYQTSGLVIIILIAAIYCIIGVVKDHFGDFSGETVEYVWESESELLPEEDIYQLYYWDEPQGRIYSLGSQYGPVLIGGEMEAGKYLLSVEAGRAEVEVRNSNQTQDSNISAGDTMSVVLNEGDEVCVKEDSSAERVLFYLYDESRDDEEQND